MPYRCQVESRRATVACAQFRIVFDKEVCVTSTVKNPVFMAIEGIWQLPAGRQGVAGLGSGLGGGLRGAVMDEWSGGRHMEPMTLFYCAYGSLSHAHHDHPSVRPQCVQVVSIEQVVRGSGTACG